MKPLFNETKRNYGWVIFFRYILKLSALPASTWLKSITTVSELIEITVPTPPLEVVSTEPTLMLPVICERFTVTIMSGFFSPLPAMSWVWGY